MAPMPHELKLTTRIDLQCARCGHVGALITTTLPLLGTTLDQAAKPLPVVDVRVGAATVESACESCHQSVRWRGASLTHDFPEDAYPRPEMGDAFWRAAEAGRRRAEADTSLPTGHEIGEDRGGL